MKKISLILTLLAAVPLISTACKNDKGSNGDGDGDGDGDTGDGDGDTGGTMGDGDGDGDTGGTVGDGDGDTGGTVGTGGDGMGGMGGNGLGGMGGNEGGGDLASLCTAVCEVKVAEGCFGEMNQTACEVACEMGSQGCEAEWLARITCESELTADDWECNPNAGGFLPWYTQSGVTACGDALDEYNDCAAL